MPAHQKPHESAKAMAISAQSERSAAGGIFSAEQTLKALSELAKIDSGRMALSRTRQALSAKELELFEHVRSSCISRMRDKFPSDFRKASSLPLCAAQAIIDGDSFSGWIIVGRKTLSDSSAGQAGVLAPSAPARLSCEGTRIAFSFRSSSLSGPESLSISDVSGMALSGAPGDFQLTLVRSPPASPGKLLSDCASLLSSIAMQERRAADFWLEMPADFHLYVGAALARTISRALSAIPHDSSRRLASELNDSMRGRKLIIETEADDSGRPLYFLDLPSFSVSFRLSHDGTPQVERIWGNSSFLFWSSRKLLFGSA